MGLRSLIRRFSKFRAASAARKARLWTQPEQLESRTLLAANPVVLENQRPGNPQTEWDVSGVGDLNILGYSTDISVNVGQTVNFKIDDKLSAPYRLDIYRMGYYAGLGARKVATVPSTQTLKVVQPAPLTDASTGL